MMLIIMFSYMVSFIFGVFVAQEYNIPNVKRTTEDILRRFKK